MIHRLLSLLRRPIGPREPMSPALARVYARTHPSRSRTRRFL